MGDYWLYCSIDGQYTTAIKELRQRRIELGMSFNEFDTVWMLEKMRKRRKIENFELQSLRNVVKEGGRDIFSNFEKKFKETRYSISQ